MCSLTVKYQGMPDFCSNTRQELLPRFDAAREPSSRLRSGERIAILSSDYLSSPDEFHYSSIQGLKWLP
jgi:hypothetical protein